MIALAKQGSVSAFSELVENYQERLLRFLVTRCRSRADAEDAIQDTFINAFRYIGSYNPRWKFSTWLFRIALRNAAKVSEQADSIESDVPSEPGMAQSLGSIINGLIALQAFNDELDPQLLSLIQIEFLGPLLAKADLRTQSDQTTRGRPESNHSDKIFSSRV